MTLKRRRSHYQLFAEFERGGIKELKKVDFLPTVLQKDLVEMYPLWMNFGSGGPGKAQPQENYVPATHRSPLAENTAVFTAWLRT
ncbi:hypothetical protein TNCV_308431 [Trichonephila clavipes]|nr:hypothetical protein TNCV_308431 [Trichonephila clavipes]